MKIFGILLLLSVSLALIPGPIFFSEDFVDVSDWARVSGEGTLEAGGLFNGTASWKTVFTQTWDTWEKQVEIVIDSANGYWQINLIEADNNQLKLIGSNSSGLFEFTMVSAYEVNAMLISIQGLVDFGSIRVYQDTDVGHEGLLADIDNWLAELSRNVPWAMPTAVAIGLIAVAALLFFGKRKK